MPYGAGRHEKTEESLMEKKLDVIAIVKNGIELGMKNLVPILVNALLWVLTI